MTTVDYVLAEGEDDDVLVPDMQHAAAVVDTTPPSFSGIESADPIGLDSIEVTWAEAIDDASAAGEIAYEIHVSRTEAAPFQVRAVSEPGATVQIVDGLLPGTSYFVRVRARDKAGNVSADDIGTELSVTTQADQPPTFDGVLNATPIGPDAISVALIPASDDTTDPSGIVYEIHVAKTPGEPFTVRAASEPGGRSHVVAGLNANTTYFVRARARDMAGNVSTDGGVEVQATTPDDLAAHPSFVIVSPTEGETITPSTPIIFDVTDDTGAFRRTVVHVSFPDTGVVEVAHDGDSFAPYYAGASSRQMIEGGYRFAVLRVGGWRSAPVIKVIAIDRDGYEV